MDMKAISWLYHKILTSVKPTNSKFHSCSSNFVNQNLENTCCYAIHSDFIQGNRNITPNLPLNFITPPLALSSVTLHSRLKTELFSLSYPDSTPMAPNVRYHH